MIHTLKKSKIEHPIKRILLKFNVLTQPYRHIKCGGENETSFFFYNF